MMNLSRIHAVSSPARSEALLRGGSSFLYGPQARPGGLGGGANQKNYPGGASSPHACQPQQYPT